MRKALPELLARFTIGWVFIESGWGKLHNLPKVISYFESLHIPLAHLQAPFVSGLELIAGVLVAIGFKTRLASLPLIAIMSVAIATAKLEDVDGVSSLLGLSEFLYIVILSWLVIYGSSYLSLDQILYRRRAEEQK